MRYMSNERLITELANEVMYHITMPGKEKEILAFEGSSQGQKG